MSLKNYATERPNPLKVIGHSLLICGFAGGFAGILILGSETKDRDAHPEYYKKRKEFIEERNSKIDSIKNIYSRKLDSLAHADYLNDLESLTK